MSWIILLWPQQHPSRILDFLLVGVSGGGGGWVCVCHTRLVTSFTIHHPLQPPQLQHHRWTLANWKQSDEKMVFPFPIHRCIFLLNVWKDCIFLSCKYSALAWSASTRCKVIWAGWPGGCCRLSLQSCRAAERGLHAEHLKAVSHSQAFSWPARCRLQAAHRPPMNEFHE